MPILNYTTKIDVRRTAGEIQDILAEAGANMVVIEYNQERIPEAIYFQVEIQGRNVSFRLPSRWQGVHKLLSEDKIERRYKTEEQARRVSWRIVKDWVEAQLAIIQAGTAELAEVFLPYAVNPKSGRTLYDEFTSGLLLPPGDITEGDYREVE